MASKKKASKASAAKVFRSKPQAAKRAKRPSKANVKAKPARTAKPSKPASRRAKPEAKAPPARVARPKAKAAGVGEGDRVPAFELEDQSGEKFSSSELEGEPYVLYFYPKDDTPGCTVEACGFRDSLSNFTARGVRVIGVSPDSSASHARFRDKHGLNFTLLSDPARQLAEAFGVWVKKQNYGREYMGIERSTFVVDPDGVVHKAWRGVRVPGHVDQVLEAVRALR
jgi:peroxiredoxin Q/BCP